eukprot:TRINITY_DN18959_c0_g1_i1.p2 TRINITY_DN18959_c0_g1~~TRINITY_DN18959_c0_g1_i1.p2  ORF type:complete len:242 (+),score=65.88 TRINITY_DN18959_c0_g1_i1:51-728(+)
MKCKNYMLRPGLWRFPAAVMKKKLYAARHDTKANAGKKPVAVKKPVEKKSKVPLKWYPTEGVRHSRRRVFKHNPTKLRKSLTPGTVVILLSGRFKGRRAIFLKQLESGLVLICGPFSLNGVPLRRYNQAYLIATSTHVDLKGIKIDRKFNDKYFKRQCKRVHPKKEKLFFTHPRVKAAMPKEKKADQRAFDRLIAPRIKKNQMLVHYLRAHFTLQKADKPHMMKF